jgi:LPPG:FO 2-phospho-L-lactate transferase
VLDALAGLGEPAWFRIGDKDLATHLVRANMIRRGGTLTEASLEICRRFGLQTRVLPMTDQVVKTRFITGVGAFSFQEYFVRERLAPRIRAIEFDGIEASQPTREVVAALAEADLVVVGPSNPLISVAPILRILGPRIPRDRTVAVTPIVGGIALKGPTVEMMRAMGQDPTPLEVARMYSNVAAGFVLDSRDQTQQEAIGSMGYRVVVCDTVMRDGGGRLAASIVEAFAAV